jgi:hypothetical protein
MGFPSPTAREMIAVNAIMATSNAKPFKTVSNLQKRTTGLVDGNSANIRLTVRARNHQKAAKAASKRPITALGTQVPGSRMRLLTMIALSTSQTTAPIDPNHRFIHANPHL